MKQAILKGISLTVLGATMATGLYAQSGKPSYYNDFKTWSVGANLGLTSPSLLIGGQNDFSHSLSKFAYGIYVKKQLTPTFSIKLDGNMGNIGGDNSSPYKSGRESGSKLFFDSYQTKFISGALSVQANLLNLDLFRTENMLQFYTSAGAGLISYQTALTKAGSTRNYTPAKISELVIPIGLGAKIKVSDNINVDLGYTMNFVDADNLDGIWSGGKNDKYGYTYAGLEFALGAKSKKQLAFNNPVAVTYEQIAAVKDSSQKAIADQKAENAKLKSDVDALSKDTDGDGVSDKFDKCENTPAGTPVDGSGCPLPKAAPIVQKVEKTVVTKEDRLIVANAIKNLEFDFGKSTIRSKSFASLDRVAQLLQEKGFTLSLSGYTDNIGSNAANERLSDNRANAVKDHLVSKGVDALKVNAKGYGESNPIASNKTKSGRQKNRRVEFTLAN